MKDMTSLCVDLVTIHAEVSLATQGLTVDNSGYFGCCKAAIRTKDETNHIIYSQLPDFPYNKE